MNDLFGNPVVKHKPVSRELLTGALIESLEGISSRELAGMITNRVDAIVEFGRLCNNKRAGQKISLLFNPQRLDTATNKSKSLISAMDDCSFCSGLARALSWKDGRVAELLYQCIQLGINGIQYVNEFPPHVARDIYADYNAERILDPCAGWGGRMIGAASVGAFYHGFEPASETYAGLIKLGEFLKSFGTGFDYKLECLPFEDANISAEYDVAFTSPPYYDTELYSSESTQASKYATFDDFVRGFYFPMIDKATSVAQQGLILNVGDRQYPMRSVVDDAYSTELTNGFSLSGKGGLGKGKKSGEVFLRIKQKGGDNGIFFKR